MPLEIMPGVGVGPLRRGVTAWEVLTGFGEPQTYEDWMGGNLNDCLFFHGILVYFDDSEGDGPLPEAQIDSIAVRGREDAILFGQPLKSWTKESITNRLAREGLQPEETPHGHVHARGLSLQFLPSGALVRVDVELV